MTFIDKEVNRCTEDYMGYIQQESKFIILYLEYVFKIGIISLLV